MVPSRRVESSAAGTAQPMGSARMTAPFVFGRSRPARRLPRSARSPGSSTDRPAIDDEREVKVEKLDRITQARCIGEVLRDEQRQRRVVRRRTRSHGSVPGGSRARTFQPLDRWPTLPRQSQVRHLPHRPANPPESFQRGADKARIQPLQQTRPFLSTAALAATSRSSDSDGRESAVCRTARRSA